MPYQVLTWFPIIWNSIDGCFCYFLPILAPFLLIIVQVPFSLFWGLLFSLATCRPFSIVQQLLFFWCRLPPSNRGLSFHFSAVWVLVLLFYHLFPQFIPFVFLIHLRDLPIIPLLFSLPRSSYQATPSNLSITSSITVFLFNCSPSTVLSQSDVYSLFLWWSYFSWFQLHRSLSEDTIFNYKDSFFSIPNFDCRLLSTSLFHFIQTSFWVVSWVPCFLEWANHCV